MAPQSHWQAQAMTGSSIAIANRVHLDYQLEQFMEAV
jgi:hypothetical protein